MATPARRPAVAADLVALETPAEIVHGTVVDKAQPSAEHGDAQASVVSFLRRRFHRGGDPPTGWWIMTEVEIELGAHEVYRPDVLGWRRERVTERPRGRPIRIVPDWICEVISASNARTDLVDKFRVYQRSRVMHYWVVDPDREILTVYRLQDSGYAVALQAGRGEVVRAEPFDSVDLRVDVLFGDDDEP